MQQTVDQDDTNAQRAGEDPAGARLAAAPEVQARARSQAALVRESLVRCPGGDGTAPQ
jgi:hypothetical protein